MAKATLTIASKNYGSWSLRGWLLCKMAGLDFTEQTVASDDPSTRAELLLLSPSFLVPCLTHNGIKVWAGAQADIERIVSIWRECLATDKGPFLFGASPCMADAMFAPVVSRFLSYDVKLDSDCAAYCATIMDMPPMREWVAGAKAEPDEVVELDVEF
jgi:glutathione S-transferase